MDKLLMLFVKYPAPGKVKTRLGKDIGFKKAAEIYKTLVKKQLRDLSSPDYDLVVCADPGDDSAYPGYDLAAYQKQFGNRQPYWFQNGCDLGERMANALVTAFDKGYSQALLMGSDIPLVDRPGINSFFAHLGTCQAVIGPALDGGYYLIGCKAGVNFNCLFKEIPWSTSRVFQTTMEKGSKLDIGVGKKWFDLDTAADLKRYETLKSEGKSFSDTQITPDG